RSGCTHPDRPLRGPSRLTKGLPVRRFNNARIVPSRGLVRVSSGLGSRCEPALARTWLRILTEVLAMLSDVPSVPASATASAPDKRPASVRADTRPRADKWPGAARTDKWPLVSTATTDKWPVDLRADKWPTA